MPFYIKRNGVLVPCNLLGRINGATVPLDLIPSDGTGTVDPPPPTGVPNKVTIGSQTRTIDSVNTFRDTNHLSLYTPDYAAVTPTNQYGTEVTVVNNVVTSVIDRNAFGPVTGTAIPTNGYVLSGHEAGAPVFPNNSAKWLRDNAVIGATVQLTHDSTVEPPPDPPVDPPPVDPTDPGVPNKLEELSIWNYAWSDSRGAARTFADYPLSFYNELSVIIISMGQSPNGQSGTGYLTDPIMAGYPSVSAAKSAIQSFINSGSHKFVLFGFGGSNDGGIRLVTTQHADQMFSSIQRVVSTFGVNGISIDMEGAPGSTWTKEAMTYLCQKLKQTYGNRFFIDACFGLYDERKILWPQFLAYAGNAVDRASTMLYDFVEAADSRIIQVTKDKLQLLKNGGVPLRKAVMLYAARPATWTYPATTPTAQLVADAVNGAKAAYGADGYDGKYGWWEDKALYSQSPRFKQALEAMTLI